MTAMMQRFDASDFDYSNRIAPMATVYAVLSLTDYTEEGVVGAQKFIQLIKRIRHLTGMGLKDSKAAADIVRTGAVVDLGFLRYEDTGHAKVLELAEFVTIRIRRCDADVMPRYNHLKLILPGEHGGYDESHRTMVDP